MKIKGRKIEKAPVEVIVFPRQDEDLVITVQAVLDYDECDKLDPKPLPPSRMLPGGAVQQNVQDAKYQEKLNAWAVNRSHYMIMKSLEATEGLEWETVKMDDPSTWKNTEIELNKGGLASGEVAHIVTKILQINGLDEQKIDEATKSFLARRAATAKDS